MKFFSLILLTTLFVAPLAAQETAGDGAPPAQGTPTPGAEANGAIPPTGAEGKGKGGASELDFIARSNFIFAKLMKSTRSMDPFGQQMDPANAKESPMLAEQYAEIEETPTLNNSSLKSALLTLPITGVYPQRNLIVIGARSFAAGGQFGMKLQELTIRLRFEGVRGKQIFFKDMETQEVTSIEFDPRPQEFEPLTNAGPQPLGSGIVSMKELFIAN
jgi:hypothetical protein